MTGEELINNFICEMEAKFERLKDKAYELQDFYIYYDKSRWRIPAQSMPYADYDIILILIDGKIITAKSTYDCTFIDNEKNIIYAKDVEFWSYNPRSRK